VPNSVSAGELIQRWIKGPTSKRREGRGQEGAGEEGEVTLPFLSPPLPSLRSRGREGREREGRNPTPSRPLIHISGYAPEIITIITSIMSCYHYDYRNHSESANLGHDK